MKQAKRLIMVFGLLFIVICMINVHNINAYPDVEIEEYFEKDYGINLKSMPQQTHVVFSNKTGLFYYFYYSAYDLCYDVIDRNGNIIFEREKIIESGADDGYAYSWVLEDYDISIDRYGEKIYIFIYHDKPLDDYDTDDLYSYYCLTNDNSLKIDVLSINEVTPFSDYSTRTRHVDGFIGYNGYPVCVYENREDFQFSHPAISFSNSFLEWNNTYQKSIETIWIANGGDNYANYGWSLKVVAYKKYGYGIVFSAFDNFGVNHWIDGLGVLRCEKDTWVIENDNATAWSNQVIHSPTPYLYSPNDKHWLWTATGIFNNKWEYNIIIAFQNITKTYLKYYHKGYDGSYSQELESFSLNEEIKPHIVMNDRRNKTIVYIRDNEDNIFYGFKFNKTSNKFNETKFIMCKTNGGTLGYYDYVCYGSDYALNYGNKKANSGQIQWERTNIYNNSMAGFGWFYLDLFEYPESPQYPIIYNVTLMDDEDNKLCPNGYLFLDEIYRLIVETENSDYCRLNFTDGYSEIEFLWNKTNNKYEINSDDNDKIFFIKGKTTTKNNITILEWSFSLLSNIKDSNPTLYGQASNNNITIYFNDLCSFYIFNLGEYTKYDIVGNGGHIQYEDSLAVECWGIGSMVTATTTYRKLQHMHFNVELDNGGDWFDANDEFVNMTGGYYEFGMNYMINNTMLNGWYVFIYPYTAEIGNHGILADSDWIKWKVEHHVYNASYGDYQLRKEEFLYSNYNGYDSEHSTKGYTNKTNSNWWVDLWFSSENSSSIVATRVNPEYYGMYEQSEIYWFGYGSFRPMFGDIELSMFFESAYNGIGEITTIHGEVDLVQFYSRVGITSGDNIYQIKSFEMKNKEFATDEMIGIDTPALVETKVIDMPQTGFLSPLIKMISNIGSLIIGAIFYILGGLGGLVDNMLIRLGLPPIMSIFYELLKGIYSIFEIIYASFLDIIDWLIISATQIISSLFLIIPRYLLFVGIILDVFISYYNNIILLFTGGIGNMSNFWADYSVSDIIQIYLIAILPFTIIAKIESSKDPIKELGDYVELFIQMIKAVFSIANDMLNVLLDFIKSIMGVI